MSTPLCYLASKRVCVKASTEEREQLNAKGESERHGVRKWRR